MLVKLGNAWFDASKVERIIPSIPPVGLVVSANGSEAKPLPDGKNNHWVSVRTFNCSDTVVAYVDSAADAEQLADAYAEIVNKARKD